jgi:hypothetical protein
MEMKPTDVCTTRGVLRFYHLYVEKTSVILHNTNGRLFFSTGGKRMAQHELMGHPGEIAPKT